MQRMPVVLTTRWPWMVIARAPPFHMALTTAWMSCWCTIRSLGSIVELAVTSAEASERVTVTPGPLSATRPAGPFIAAALWLKLRTCLLPTVLLSSAIWAFRSETVDFSPSTRVASYRTIEARSVKRPGRRSVPSLLWALITKSAPLSRPTRGVATRHTRDLRGRCRAAAGSPASAAGAAAPAAGARRLRSGLSVTPTKVSRVVAEDAIPASMAWRSAGGQAQGQADVRRSRSGAAGQRALHRGDRARRDRHRLDRLLLHRGARRPDRAAAPGPGVAEVHGRPRGLELRHRLRADPARPAGLGAPGHAVGSRPWRRGGDARLLPGRPAVDLHVLRDLRRPAAQRPGLQRSRPVQPDGRHRLHGRRLRLRHPLGVSASGTGRVPELHGCDYPQVIPQLWTAATSARRSG